MKTIVSAIYAGVILLITGFFAFQLTAMVYMGRFAFNNPDVDGIYAKVNGSDGMYSTFAEV